MLVGVRGPFQLLLLYCHERLTVSGKGKCPIKIWHAVKVRDWVEHISWSIYFSFFQANSLIESEIISMYFIEISGYVHTRRGKNPTFIPFLSHQFFSSFYSIIKIQQSTEKSTGNHPWKCWLLESGTIFFNINRSSYKFVSLKTLRILARVQQFPFP